MGSYKPSRNDDDYTQRDRFLVHTRSYDGKNIQEFILFDDPRPRIDGFD